MLAGLSITIMLVLLLMRPRVADFVQLAALLGLSALVSITIGYLAYRMDWWRRLGSLSLSLTVAYLLAVGLLLLNVWVTARLMFINQHDFILASLMLLFAGIISVSFGVLLSNSITASLLEMVEGAEMLSEGDFSTRVPVTGKDEVAQLAVAFNSMAERLEHADEESRRLENARRDLVAWVSHDLRTPLSAMRVMIDALAEGVVKEPEMVSRYLAQSQAEIQRLSDLIDNLFELSQLDAAVLKLHFEDCSLSDLISDAMGGVAARAEANEIRLTGVVSPQVDPVRIAPREISRVLYNLLDNALRHTPSGGSIHLGANSSDKSVQVSIQDTGMGIAAEDLPRVFEDFYRGEKSRTRQGSTGGGAGLGLAIAKGLIAAHGGKIWAESAPEQGTSVFFTLPRLGPQQNRSSNI